ncbi:hypothetical protein [Streptomyces sp. A1547]|uniref:Uncharacterized protein n=1 Tax=Streptomyces sp. R33 TaxID=3238629 RepID=A0AB39YGH4_9ACTN|nr:hypothetical protein [Streptomyces sp. A1547]THA39833.1 hypothetical protein E6W17_09715 [Streptomyces sp. A1547]
MPSQASKSAVPSKSPFQWADRTITFAFLLASARGDGAEAARERAEIEEAMRKTAAATAGRIGMKAEPLWVRAMSILGFRAGAWFLITALVLVGGLLLPRSELSGYLTVTVAAFPAALCASREAAHEIARSALRRERLTQRGRCWYSRVQHDGFVALLVLPLWAACAAAVQPWA